MEKLGISLKGKVAVVTGGGRGIGRAESMALAAAGAQVVVNDLGGGADGTGEASRGPADTVVREIRELGGQAVACYDSVATFQGGERIIQTALDKYGRLDILVNNAGITADRKWIWELTEAEWDRMIAVHLKGHFACTTYACIVFRAQRSGRIINTSSAAGLGVTGNAHYNAAKEGIVGLTRTVAREMGQYGVTCNAIRPIASSRMTAQTLANLEQYERQGLRLPEGLREALQRPPEAVAPLVVYLASDEAGTINGYDFAVTGGKIALFSQPQEVKTIYKEGIWTVEELRQVMPKTLAAGLANTALSAPQT